MIRKLMKRALSDKASLLANKLNSRIRQYIENKNNINKTSQEIFGDIYKHAKWGGKAGEINSGTGSYGPAAELYIENVNRFIVDNSIHSVIDIGCGDFSIGQRLICDDYTGIDVVKDVVDRNNTKFRNRNRRFVCLDVSGPDELPSADLCLVRQVLQHLSNKQVTSIMNKAVKFSNLIVTEHHPAHADFKSFNKDIIQGSNTRLTYGSGLYLERHPFDFNVKLLFAFNGDLTAKDIYQRGSIKSFLVKPSKI